MKRINSLPIAALLFAISTVFVTILDGSWKGLVSLGILAITCAILAVADNGP